MRNRHLAPGSCWITWACALAACQCDEARLAETEGRLTLEPLVVDFGYQPVAARAIRAVRVANIGRKPIGLLAVDIEGYGGFSAVDAVSISASGISVPPGGWFELTFDYAPATPGPHEARATVRSDSRDTPAVTLLLKGIGFTPDLSCAPSSLDLGRAPVGGEVTRTLEIRNHTAADLVFELECPRLGALLTIEPGAGPRAGEPLACVGTERLSVSASGSLPLRVRFRPPQIEVVHDRIVLLLGSTPVACAIEARGVGSPLVVDPPHLDFGFVHPSHTVRRWITVSNVGLEPIDGLTIAPPLAPFTLAAAEDLSGAPVDLAGLEQLEPGPERALRIAMDYAPTDVGSIHLDMLEVSGLDQGQVVTGVSDLEGRSGGPILSVAPTALRFGPTAVGDMRRRSVLVRNIGTRAAAADDADLLHVRASLSPESDWAYTLVDAPPSLFIAPGESEILRVEFAPGEEGEMAGQLVLASNDPTSERVDVPLSGTGESLAPCQLEIQPQAVEFGIATPGDPRWSVVRLINAGADDCILSDFETADDPAGAFFVERETALRIEPAGEAWLPVRYEPPPLSPEQASRAHEAQLRFRYSNPDESAPPGACDPGYGCVPLHGEARNGCLSVLPSTLDFGTQDVGCSTEEREVWVSNGCSHPESVTALGFVGSTGAFIVAYAPSLPAVLGPYEERTVALRFRPDATRSYVDSLVLNTSVSSTPYVVLLRGNGDTAGLHSDRFTQLAHKRGDVLFVIDNSGSMENEQAALGSNLGAFLAFADAEQIDYHLGVTTTGIVPGPDGCRCRGHNEGAERGRLFPVRTHPYPGTDAACSDAPAWPAVPSPWPTFLTPDTPDADTVFQLNTQVGLCHVVEDGLEAALRAVTAPTRDVENVGFLRDDAYLGIVLVSDADDDASDVDVNGSPRYRSVEAYANAFLQLKGPARSHFVTVNGILGRPTSPLACRGEGFEVGARYEQVIQATGGVIADICNSDWSDTLLSVVREAVGYRREFPLSQTPAGPVELRMDGALQTAGFSYDADRRRVVFEVPPVPGTRIEIRYPVACL